MCAQRHLKKGLVIKYRDGPAKSRVWDTFLSSLKGVGHHRNGTTWRVFFIFLLENQGGSCIFQLPYGDGSHKNSLPVL